MGQGCLQPEAAGEGHPAQSWAVLVPEEVCKLADTARQGRTADFGETLVFKEVLVSVSSILVFFVHVMRAL